MKIISKYKDYYDYYQGIYGVDEKKVYDRRDILKIDNPFDCNFDDIFCRLFSINNKLYPIFYNKNNVYYTESEIKILDNNKKYGTKWSKTNYIDIYNKLKNANININSETRKPVICSHINIDFIFGWSMYNNDDIKSNFYSGREFTPLLSDFNFHKVLTDKEVYIEIETFIGWLNDNPEPENNQTNEEKIISHGFDTKISFRKIK